MQRSDHRDALGGASLARPLWLPLDGVSEEEEEEDPGAIRGSRTYLGSRGPSSAPLVGGTWGSQAPHLILWGHEGL